MHLYDYRRSLNARWSRTRTHRICPLVVRAQQRHQRVVLTRQPLAQQHRGDTAASRKSTNASNVQWYVIVRILSGSGEFHRCIIRRKSTGNTRARTYRPRSSWCVRSATLSLSTSITSNIIYAITSIRSRSNALSASTHALTKACSTRT